MRVTKASTTLELPASLETQLNDFRGRVWLIKSIEAACGALFGVGLAYLMVFGLDRFWDTPDWARQAIFAVAVGVCACVPVYLHRWVWRHRRLEQLARLLSRRYPSIGDQMLGIIELVNNEQEQARSRALCEAAIKQVAETASKRNFRDAVPNPRHRLWAALAAVPVLAALIALVLVPSAATNAWARFLKPWQSVPRYTFTSIQKLPDQVVVPHGEPTTVDLRLLKDSQWQPASGSAQLGSQKSVSAPLKNSSYAFTLPPQIDDGWCNLHIGDWRQRVHVEPMLRPELTAITADVELPKYLQRPQMLHKDVRGGTLSLVNGSRTKFTATANRDLLSGLVDGRKATTAKASVISAASTVDASRKVVIEWRDKFGLMGQEPFTLSITARADEPPSLSCEDLPRQKIVLVSETLNFKVRAQDDFGIKVVGLEWQGSDKAVVAKPAQGEQVLAAGGSEKDVMDMAGTFCAEKLKIEPQPINLRIFAEDYLPGRGRVYSATYAFYVLSAEQHYIYITEQLSKWHRQSLEVRDREMQLHQTNQQLRALSAEELDQPETRRRIELQASAERANGRRLTGLVAGGEDLVRQAMRNPEFGVGHLEKWAEMLTILKDISGSRMPNVADLLKQSSQAPGALAQSDPKRQPQAGQNRTPGGAKESKPAESKPMQPVPKISDGESSQHVAKNKDEEPKEDPSKSPAKQGRLTLPVTTIADPNPKKSPPKPATPAAEKLDEAVKAQKDLLAEFDRIAEELNKVLANLEGSTLVKRLKAASRQQYSLAGKLGTQLGDTFGNRGVGKQDREKSTEVLTDVSKLEVASSLNLSNIMDDMDAYFERRHFQRFKTVLDEMRKEDAIGSLRQLSDDVRVEPGMSIAQCEFWSDTMDRWADNLVDPACGGKCPGCKSKSSLPPSLVLEAMQILEAEINLREETRVAEQGRAALELAKYTEGAGKLQTTQNGLAQRTGKLVQKIKELPDGETEFGKEIALLGQVEVVMNEAGDILGRPETGKPAIAAETEAIELLLKSKRINPKAGGGGGSSPGGGGSGSTTDSALSLIGSGLNDKEVREDRGVSQTTGETGTALPEEFRAGLDEYFNRLERGREAR